MSFPISAALLDAIVLSVVIPGFFLWGNAGKVNAFFEVKEGGFYRLKIK